MTKWCFSANENARPSADILAYFTGCRYFSQYFSRDYSASLVGAPHDELKRAKWIQCGLVYPGYVQWNENQSFIHSCCSSCTCRQTFVNQEDDIINRIRRDMREAYGHSSESVKSYCTAIWLRVPHNYQLLRRMNKINFSMATKVCFKIISLISLRSFKQQFRSWRLWRHTTIEQRIAEQKLPLEIDITFFNKYLGKKASAASDRNTGDNDISRRNTTHNRWAAFLNQRNRTVRFTYTIIILIPCHCGY